MSDQAPVGPVAGTKVPRFAGDPTFARLPRIDAVGRYDVAVLGAPFDAGTSYRPGARFGPIAVRTASRHLRPAYHQELGVQPYQTLQVVDAGDVSANPFSITEALESIQRHASEVLENGSRLITIGGDHTVALALLRSIRARQGPVALVHFDAHLDTWDTYFGAPVTHGTVFRRAFEEGLLIEDHSIHVGIRGPVYDALDLDEQDGFGFKVVRAVDLDQRGFEEVADLIRRRVGACPVYVSIDVDVLDPAFAPGTGTPEMGGFTSRELLRLLRSLDGLAIVAADVVEVSPPYDVSEITALAAATLMYDLTSLMAKRAEGATAGAVEGSLNAVQPGIAH
ncbi:MAG: agmatinase [Acidimicrobiaceae bacterium]|nr:agmatinase [Acidimicrobiaceae bacterium]